MPWGSEGWECANDRACVRRCEARNDRKCAWCGDLLSDRGRADTVTCSKRCRQARWRFNRSVGAAHEQASRPVRVAVADPPYPGLSARYYSDHPDYAGEVDQAELLGRLEDYDGWALATAARSLPDVLALAPAGVRVAAWHRGGRPNSSAAWPRSAWEPVIYRSARRRTGGTPPDSLVCGVSVRRSDPGRVIGAKPAAWWRWVFDLIGVLPGDEFSDLYPGSGGGGRAWQVFTADVSLTAETNVWSPPVFSGP